MRTIMLWGLLACAGLGSAVVLEGTLSEGRYCDRREGGIGSCRQKDNCYGGDEMERVGCSYPLVCCPLPGEVSSEKCKLYSEIETSSWCPRGDHLVAQPKEFPFMAALGYHNIQRNEWLCGGILISERFVLTAAQCVSHTPVGPPLRVRLGDLRQDDERVDHVQQITVEAVIPHPEYKAKAQNYDIALLKLSKKVELNSYVRPACLYTKNELPASSGLAVGWGVTEDRTRANDLLRVELPFVSGDACSAKYEKLFDDASMICAGDKGRDTCRGDNGGPLQVPRMGPGCMADVVGITSFGSRQCGGEYPSVFTKVSHFLPWIERIVWP